MYNGTLTEGYRLSLPNPNNRNLECSEIQGFGALTQYPFDFRVFGNLWIRDTQPVKSMQTFQNPKKPLKSEIFLKRNTLQKKNIQPVFMLTLCEAL